MVRVTCDSLCRFRQNDSSAGRQTAPDRVFPYEGTSQAVFLRNIAGYIGIFADFDDNPNRAINNFMLHKVLPKMTFDGNREATPDASRLELLFSMAAGLADSLAPGAGPDEEFSAHRALLSIATRAKANDGVVNYWS